MIHAQVCDKGFDTKANTFIQAYGAPHLDASLLLIPQVGFLPGDDPRVLGTVAAIERHLLVNGLLLRYSTETDVDALPPGEGAFLPCSFWLADCYLLSGAARMPKPFSSDCSHSATTLGCSPKNTIRAPGECWVISLKRSRTWRW